jgi:hypothetical protein
LNEVRQDEVSKNLESALGNLTGVTRSNPEDLTGDVDAIRRLWAMELLQGDDAETALARF